MSGSILLVAGPPGAGKSTVAALVADRFERSVHLHTDDFYAWIARGLRRALAGGVVRRRTC